MAPHTFILCKNYSTCGSGVQPTAPGNDIHNVVYTIPAKSALNLVAIVTGHKHLITKVIHSNFVPQ